MNPNEVMSAKLLAMDSELVRGSVLKSFLAQRFHVTGRIA